jgi:hypothetical protein
MSTPVIQETEHVFKFALFLLKGLDQAKKNDGSISMFEALAVVAQSLPLAIQAFQGYDKILGELKDLDQEEMQKLAVMSIELAKAIMDLLLVNQKSFKLEGVV